jgi:hypothetical protein
MNAVGIVGLDALLLALIGFNLWTLRTNRRLMKELRKGSEELNKAYREKAETMIGALENLACATCPLCAAAAGRGEIEGPFGQLTAEPEMGGEHIVRFSGKSGHGHSECRAAKCRADAREIFAESMGESEAAVSGRLPVAGEAKKRRAS